MWNINYMKNKLFVIFFVAVLVLSISHISYAQTQPVTNNVETPVPTASITVSDYALDVQQGKQSVNNDTEAQNNQKDVIDNESIEAHEEIEAVEPVEKIEPKEAVEPQEAVENESEGEKSGGEKKILKG